jgi:hypothetical protein
LELGLHNRREEKRSQRCRGHFLGPGCTETDPLCCPDDLKFVEGTLNDVVARIRNQCAEVVPVPGESEHLRVRGTEYELVRAVRASGDHGTEEAVEVDFRGGDSMPPVDEAG